MTTAHATPEARPARVYPLLVLGLLSFSASPILVRYAADAPALAIAVWRTIFAVALLAPVALVRIGPEVRRLTKRDAVLIGAAGVLLGLHFVAWISSLYFTSVASASALVTTNPIFLALLGFLFLRERPAPGVTSAILLGVVGAVLIGWGDLAAPVFGGARPLLGNMLALTASLLVSIYLLIGRVVRQKLSWLAYVFPLYSVVAATVVVLALVMDVPLFGHEPLFYGLCLLMAVFPTLLGHGSFNYAIRYFPAAFLGLLALSEPVGASIMALLFFGEVPGWLALVGIVTVLASVALAILARRRAAARAS